jgi:hypothetical protein
MLKMPHEEQEISSASVQLCHSRYYEAAVKRRITSVGEPSLSRLVYRHRDRLDVGMAMVT